MKKIAIDLTPFVYGRAAGYNEYVFNLLDGFVIALKEKKMFVVLFIRKDQDIYFEKYSDFFEFNYCPSDTVAGRVIWQNLIMPFVLRKFSAVLYTGNLASFFCFIPYCLVVHDLNFKKYPKNFSKLTYVYKSLFTKRSIRCAKKTIVISENVKSELQALGFHDPVVIKNSVSDVSDFECDVPFEGRKFILCASSLDSHKNIESAYLAVRRFVALEPNLVFVFIGNWKVDDFPGSELRGRIYLEGYVSRYRKNQLLKYCSCVLSPSLYEGFGMPYAEAMVNNKLLICCDIDIAREVVSDYPVYINPPFDENSIFSALKNALNLQFKIFRPSSICDYNIDVVATKYIEVLHEFLE